QRTGNWNKGEEFGRWFVVSIGKLLRRSLSCHTNRCRESRGGIDRTTNVYDFAGKILVTKTTHAIAVTSATSVTRTLDYINAGRLTETHHKIDDGQNVLLTKNEYNELGQLVAKKLHSKDANSFAQQVDYRYNIRGWLTRINNSELDETEDHDPNETVNEDYFGMELSYETPFPETSAVAQFNGNISAIKWSTNLGLGQENQYDPELSRSKALAYAFTYDEMNRPEEETPYANIGGWQTSPAFHVK